MKTQLELAAGVYGYRVTYLRTKRNGAGHEEVSYGARGSQTDARLRAPYKTGFIRLVSVIPLAREEYERAFRRPNER